MMLLVCQRNADAFPRNVKWRQVHTEHFVIVFAEQHRYAGHYVAQMAESLHRDIAEFLNYTDDSETYIVITDETDTFHPYDLSAWPEGYVLLSLGQTPAGMPTFWGQSLNRLSAQFVSQYSSIIRHKMDSWLRANVVGYPFPDAGFSGWMDGGMAALLLMKEGKSPLTDMFMRAEMLAGRFTTLSRRAALGLRKWPEDFEAFVYGYSFLRYLSETYGTEQLARVNRVQSHTIPWPLFGSDPFKKVYDKNLKSLHQEWQAAMRATYETQIQEIQSQPVTKTEPFSHSGYWTHTPLFSPDGKYVYYIEESGHGDPALMQIRLSDRTKTQMAEGNFSGSFSLSADGQHIYFSKTGTYKTFYEVSDLYRLDLAARQIHRLTKGERAFDPAIAPDGKALVFVKSHAGRTDLMNMDLDNGQQTTLIATSDYSQIREPVFSSDGMQIAFQILEAGGSWDIYVMNRDGTGLKQISPDFSHATSPTWALNNEYIVFSSDYTGVPDIFAHSLLEDSLYQVTHVLTGAFEPAVSPDGNQLAIVYYSADGMDIHLAELKQDTWQKVEREAQFASAPQKSFVGSMYSPLDGEDEDVLSSESGYNPLPSLFPVISPALGEDEDGWQPGIALSGKDYLEQHEYFVALFYGLESGRAAFEAEYVNTQFSPAIHLFGYDYAKPYRDLFLDTRAEALDYWERQQGGGIDLLVPFYRSSRTDLYLTTGYEYTKLDHLTKLNEVFPPEPDTGTLASVSAGFILKSFDEYRYSISPESGVLIMAEYERNDEIFGSDFNIHKALGEVNIYLKSFFRRHVLAVRGVGGISDGDTLRQGVFQLGGYLFQTESDLWHEPQVFLRGYEANSFAGDRVFTGTVEYRFPIWFPERILWNGRILWDSITAAAFFEGGDAWEHEDDVDVKYSAGAELNMRFGFRYGRLPLGFGIGYAQGLDEDTGESQLYFSVKFDM